LKRVLITRPEPGATETAARLFASGFFPVVAPVLSIVGRELHTPDHVAAILLTSRNAVAACALSLHELPVFAVGTATARRAAETGFKHVFNADGDAGVLVKLVTESMSPADGALFLPTGQGQGWAIASALRLQGFRVVRRVAYRAVCAPELPSAAAIELHQGALSAAMFFSGETSRHFVRLIQAAGLANAVRDIDAVSISEAAAVPLRSLPWRRVGVAAKPNQDAMLVLLND
jgi:uroporphyrinogen-III synthase